MEAVLVLGCGLLVTLGVWLAEPGARTSEALSQARASIARQRLFAWLAEVGSVSVLRRLDGLASWRRASEVVGCMATGDGRPLGCEGARGLLALLVLGSSVLGVLVSRSPVGFAVGLAGSVAAVPAWSAAWQRRRSAELVREVPEVFRSLAGALGAGRTLAQAVSYVGMCGTGPVSREFRRASMALSCGMSAQEALADLADRARAPGIGLMVTALVVSRRTGAPLHELFLRSARLVERQGEFEQMLRAKTAQVRLSARIVSALPAGMVGLLALVSPDFRQGLGTPVGMGCVAVAAMLDLAALVIIRRLMKGVV